MLKFYSLIFFLTLALIPAAVQSAENAEENLYRAADTFIEGMEDIPVPGGMEQIQADNLSFGNEETRLVEAYLKGIGTRFAGVRKFYTGTLPQLGWKLQRQEKNSLFFVRDSEELEIAKEAGEPLTVRITLTGRR